MQINVITTVLFFMSTNKITKLQLLKTMSQNIIYPKDVPISCFGPYDIIENSRENTNSYSYVVDIQSQFC